ncbi:RcnB family protein [Candidatus Pantoea multigeneris]|uniref:RcnB family protein n=1 Tax=Candidatus Pantoea multigeneris TaxID=2608357 RepID=A0ABX0RH95_9GAMM|nr:RcnB family protein [Pantoea multigeneris]NIF23019.1 RcnB family protein [Pantoea multigeneris]
MKKMTSSLLASLIACSTLFSAVSWADGPGGGDQQWQHGGGEQHQDRGHGDQGGRGPGGGDRGHGGGQQEFHRGGPGPQANRGGPDRDHFAWRGHDFRRGHEVPPDFRGPRYRVDWREHHLPEPPRGEQWSYIDGNYVLIAAATGVITSLILNGAFN